MSPFAAFDLASRWVGWRNEQRGQSITKVPYGLHGRAKADDPATWVMRAQATATAKRIVNGLGGGIGIQLGDIGDGTSLGGIDLDTCRTTAGMFEFWAEEIIQKFD